MNHKITPNMNSYVEYDFLTRVSKLRSRSRVKSIFCRNNTPCCT